MRLWSALLLLLPLVSASAADKKDDKKDDTPPKITSEHYRIYRADGTPASLADILARAKTANAVFLGETHNDPAAHHLEAEIFRSLADAGPVQLAMEMFEADTQIVLNEYLAGLITEEQLISAGRAWKNYKQDYRPMVEIAKERKLPVIAANAPRRYVNRVSRLGRASLDELSTTARQWLPPLPYAEATEAYATKFNKIMASAIPAGSANPGAPKRDPKWGLDAQSLWDATMAYFVSQALERHPKQQVVHVNGGFHTEQNMGLVDHLKLYRPGVDVMVVTMRPSKEIAKFDTANDTGAGDFVILTDAKLPRSYDANPPSSDKGGKKKKKEKKKKD
ncbi:hypothetical protein F183_A08970 [Bryobacterales bacterium F-183]|nr:hypothetical protein F183_A08970 [Bryobacterales bacterium F-183]